MWPVDEEFIRCEIKIVESSALYKLARVPLFKIGQSFAINPNGVHTHVHSHVIPMDLMQNSGKIVCGTISEGSIRWHSRKRRTIPNVRYLVADHSWHDHRGGC